MVCPFCKSRIDAEATKCPRCQTWLPQPRGKQMTPAAWVMLAIIGAIAVLMVWLVAGQGGSSDSDRAASNTPPAPAAAATPEQEAAARAVMRRNTDHYQQLLDAGLAALGSKRYADGFAGVAAFSDPSSAASRWRDYRVGMKPDQDISFLQASKDADVAASGAIVRGEAEWRRAMDEAQQALYRWLGVATDWQINATTQEQFDSATSAVRAALDRARQALIG